MRIVSEDGIRDVPYEHVVLMIHDEQIMAVLDNDIAYQLAHPDTLKQAKDAMDLIREAYQKDAKVVYMDYLMEAVKEE